MLIVHVNICADISAYLQNFNEQVQAMVLNKMAAGCWRFIGEVPECTQCKFEGGVHRALSCFLTHNVKQLLQGRGGSMFAMKICLFR